MFLLIEFGIEFKCIHRQDHACISSQSLSVGIGFSVRWSRASLHARIPSLCGMLVYRDAASKVTRIAPVGISQICEGTYHT